VALKIYSSGNMVVHEKEGTSNNINLTTGREYHFPKSTMFYTVANNEYSVSRGFGKDEINIAFNLSYTDFKKEDNSTFDGQVSLENYLDDILGAINKDYGINVVNESVLVKSTETVEKLSDVVGLLRQINIHLSMGSDEIIVNES
jgi:hypothetical protein